MNRFNQAAKPDRRLAELKKFSDEQLAKYGVSHYILDESGNVMGASLMEWALWVEKNGQRVIQQDYPAEHKVSTVFIGLENELFETMVFGPEYEADFFGKKKMLRRSLWRERCETLAQALETHQRGLQWLHAYLVEKNTP